MNRTGRKDHFADCLDVTDAVAGSNFHPARAFTLERHLCDVDIQEKREVRAVEVRPQEGTRRAHAGAVGRDIHVDVAVPGAHRTVHVVDDGKTHLTRRLYESWGCRVRIARLADVNRSASPAPLVGAALPVFLGLECRQDILESPPLP